jgi:type IX secretion system PorP/SprF family membrane protein
MKYILTITFLIITTSIFSQFSDRMLMMSQYVHNQYILNPAFGGSREALSLFGSYRQQWAGSPNPPNSQSFTAHAPLKNEHVALGGMIYHETYSIYDGLKATLSYTYRLITESENKIAFSLNGGLMGHFSGREEIDIDYPDYPDPILDEIPNFQSDSHFSLGFGTAWYGKKFFLGFSIYDFFHREPFSPDNPDVQFFSLGKNFTFLFTGGYFFEFSETFGLQPSVLLVLEREKQKTADISVSAVIRNTVWVGGTYRTNKEFIGILGWNITPQFRATYSYDFPTGELSKYSAGSHEISIQYDFGYKINTSSPKFF